MHKELDIVFRETHPHHVAVEQVFFANNPKSALLLGHARGVAILSAALAELPVYEYTATETKKAVCSFGGAGKEQVNAMVKTLLNLRHDLTDHASDALAVCICHVNSYRTLQSQNNAMKRHNGRTQNRGTNQAFQKRKGIS